MESVGMRVSPSRSMRTGPIALLGNADATSSLPVDGVHHDARGFIDRSDRMALPSVSGMNILGYSLKRLSSQTR